MQLYTMDKLSEHILKMDVTGYFKELIKNSENVLRKQLKDIQKQNYIHEYKRHEAEDINCIESLPNNTALRFIRKTIHDISVKKNSKNKNLINETIKLLKKKEKQINKKIIQEEKQEYKLNNLFDKNKNLKHELEEIRKQKKEIEQKLKDEIKNNKYKNKEIKKQLKEKRNNLPSKIKEHEITRRERESKKNTEKVSFIHSEMVSENAK